MALLHHAMSRLGPESGQKDENVDFAVSTSCVHYLYTSDPQRAEDLCGRTGFGG
jgi:hypothetical protein